MSLKQAAEFVSSLPAGSAEREYHAAILAIVARIVVGKESEECAIGLLDFLTYYSFSGAGIDTAFHSAACTLEANSRLIAALFSEIHADPAWWQARSQENRPAVYEAAQWWRNQFRLSPLVHEVL